MHGHGFGVACTGHVFPHGSGTREAHAAWLAHEAGLEDWTTLNFLFVLLGGYVLVVRFRPRERFPARCAGVGRGNHVRERTFPTRSAAPLAKEGRESLRFLEDQLDA